MTNPINETIEKWQEKRDESAPPFRYEFENLDEDVQFLLSYNPRYGHKIRCSGLFFDGLIGTSVVGRSLSSLFEDQYQSRARASIDQVFTDPAIVKIQIVTMNGPVELVLLPMRAEHGPVELALGAINIKEMPKFGSPRMTLLNIDVEPLHKSSTGHAVGFAEGKSSFSHKGAPKFKVIDGDRPVKGLVRNSLFKIIKNIKREP